jgi:hypothetical protein
LDDEDDLDDPFACTQMAKRLCERYGNRRKTAKDLHWFVFAGLIGGAISGF